MTWFLITESREFVSLAGVAETNAPGEERENSGNPACS